jgi:gamma-glutamylcyclotransferase (GGCT)/AIG2-like uncharacterized protein YtfP
VRSAPGSAPATPVLRDVHEYVLVYSRSRCSPPSRCDLHRPAHQNQLVGRPLSSGEVTEGYGHRIQDFPHCARRACANNIAICRHRVRHWCDCGGGLKAFNIEIPLLATVTRQILLFLAGGIFIAAALLPAVAGGGDRDGHGSVPAEGAQHLFMYGTMKPGHSRYPGIDQFVASTTPNTVVGRLFDTGAGYPAAKFGEDGGRITGYVLRLIPERSAQATEAIADLEGNLFRPVTVETESGVTATAYEYIASTEGMTLISDGIWDTTRE